MRLDQVVAPAHPGVRQAIEYDGDAHDDTLDRARDLRAAALGWHTPRLLRTDPTPTPARTVAVIDGLVRGSSGTSRGRMYQSPAEPGGRGG